MTAVKFEWKIGMWPCPIDDIYNYSRLRNPQSSKFISSEISDNGLIDIWRTQNSKIHMAIRTPMQSLKIRLFSDIVGSHGPGP